MTIKQQISKFIQELTDIKIESKREFLKWAKNDFNGNGISDYNEI